MPATALHLIAHRHSAKNCMRSCQAVVRLRDVQVKLLKEILPNMTGQCFLLLLVSEVLGILVLPWLHGDT